MVPHPTRRYPITLPDGDEVRATVFLNQVIENPRFEVGAYSYASSFDAPEDWGRYLAPYLFWFSQETLRLGKFCQIAHGVRFLTASANHAMDGLTCYPFPIFDPARIASYHPDRRDTVIGHDVWLGYGAMVLPGARIGTGAVIGAGAVVRGEIPPYSVVIGNPGQPVRSRVPDTVRDALLELAWWDWPSEVIAEAEPALLSGDIATLESLAP